jgi:hypothetical protein
MTHKLWHAVSLHSSARNNFSAKSLIPAYIFESMAMDTGSDCTRCLRE